MTEKFVMEPIFVCLIKISQLQSAGSVPNCRSMNLRLEKERKRGYV